MSGPSAQAVIASIQKWADRSGIKVVVDKGATYRGRDWDGGIRGMVVHHWAGVGDGGLEWMAARDGSYPNCNVAVRRDGTIVVLSALSAWGSGAGGPWPAANVPKDLGHLYLFQVENESMGVAKDFNPPMFTANAVIACALREVAGSSFPDFSRVINHKGWCDGGPELGLDYYLPTRWRKSDTVYEVEVFRDAAQVMWNQFSGKPDNQSKIDAIKAKIRKLREKLKTLQG